MKRGRLFKKKKPEFGNYSYEYGFDMDGRLLRVRGVNEFTTPNSRYDEEYLIYIGDLVYGLEFNNLGKLDLVSKCFYDNGKLMTYERSLCGMEAFAELHYEKYIYDNNRLSEVNYFFNISPEEELYEENRLIIEHDQDGNIIRIVSNDVVNSNVDPFIYDVKPPKK